MVNKSQLPRDNQIALEPPVWIDTPNKLRQAIERMAREPVVAVDTESDSLYS